MAIAAFVNGATRYQAVAHPLLGAILNVDDPVLFPP